MYEKQIQRFLHLHTNKLESQHAPDGEGDDGQPPFEARTYLYIRAFVNDTGNRPVPQGTIFWLSPDIEVFDPALGQYVPEHTLIPGYTYRVDVTVNNGGDLSAAACNVDLFCTDFTVGFNNPPRVGTPQLITVPPHGTAVASFAYIPDAAGHRCLFARAWSLVSMDYPGCENADHKLITQVVDYSATMRQIGQQNLDIIQQGQSVEIAIALGALKGDAGYLLVQAAGTLPARLKRKLGGGRFVALTAQRAKVMDGVHVTRPEAVVKRPDIKLGMTDIPALSRLTVQPYIDLPPLGKLTTAARAKLRNWKLDGSGVATERLRIEVPRLGLAVNEMTALHIWLIGIDGARHGGATLVVKG